jgi:hypothetical protein
MDKKSVSLFFALMSIANENVSGFTVDSKTLQPIKSGYAVAVAETQNSFNGLGLLSVINHVQKNNNINAFGGWYNSENGKFYFDATIVVEDLETAILLGLRNKQLAIFDLANLEEIRLDRIEK